MNTEMQEKMEAILGTPEMNPKIVYFVDYGDYFNNNISSEIFVRCGRDGEIFDVCQMSDEDVSPKFHADAIALSLNALAKMHMDKGIFPSGV